MLHPAGRVRTDPGPFLFSSGYEKFSPGENATFQQGDEIMEDSDTNRGSAEMPRLLTQQEAIELLRLDQMGLQDPKETLRYLRRTGQLAYVKVAGKVLIPRKSIRDYVDAHYETT